MANNRFPYTAELKPFQDADDAWSAELQRCFGKNAGQARYEPRGKGDEGSELRKLRTVIFHNIASCPAGETLTGLGALEAAFRLLRKGNRGTNMAALRWDDCENFEPGFHLGSEGDNGEHLRDPNAGWPYSVYRRAMAIGQCDVVICHGIQSQDDAREILDRLQCLS